MKLYWVRHGDYVKANVNPEEPLSEKGKNDILRLGNFLFKNKITFSNLYHSGKLRAKETANLLMGCTATVKEIKILPGIKPNDAVPPIADQINQWDQDTMIVGHLPFIGKCISKLLMNNEDKPLIFFEPGTIVCLEKIAHRTWVIHWIIRPDLLDLNA